MIVKQQQQLEQDLNQGLSQAYLLAGEEIVCLQETLDKIKIQARVEGLDLEIIFVDVSFEGETWIQTNLTPDLFSPRRLTLFYCLPGSLNPGLYPFFESLCQPSAPGPFVLIFPLLENKHQKAKWFQSLTKVAKTVIFWPLSLAEQGSWIKRQLKQMNRQIGAEALAFWLEEEAHNLLANQQTLAYCDLLTEPGTEVSLAQLQSWIKHQSQYSLFDWVEACNLGASQKALQQLQDQLAQGVEPTLILWAGARELRLLHVLKIGQIQKQHLGPLFYQFQVLPRRQPALLKALTRLSLNQIESLLLEAQRIDALIKGIGVQNISEALLSWTLHFCYHSIPGGN